MENLQEPVLQILYKYSKIYHPEDLQHFAHLIGRLTELRTLNHNYSEILSIWKTKDSKLASLLSEKWNLYSFWWNFRMLWFVLNFLNLDCLRYDRSLWTPPAHHQKIPYVFRKLPKQLFKIKFGARIVWLWNFKFISKFKLWIPGDYMTKWANRIPSTKLETKSAWM